MAPPPWKAAFWAGLERAGPEVFLSQRCRRAAFEGPVPVPGLRDCTAGTSGTSVPAFGRPAGADILRARP